MSVTEGPIPLWMYDNTKRDKVNKDIVTKENVASIEEKMWQNHL